MDWNTFPSLTSLRAFAAAAEFRNLTKAAAALNVTHSAVSQQIRGLERHLDTRLVTRTRHGIYLTSRGEFLAAGLLEVFAKMESLTESVSSVEAVRPLVVSATPMFSSAFLMPRLSTFIEEHPHIELRIDSTIQAVDLRPGGIDLAIRYGTGKWSEFASHWSNTDGGSNFYDSSPGPLDNVFFTSNSFPSGGTLTGMGPMYLDI